MDVVPRDVGRQMDVDQMDVDQMDVGRHRQRDAATKMPLR